LNSYACFAFGAVLDLVDGLALAGAGVAKDGVETVGIEFHELFLHLADFEGASIGLHLALSLQC